MKVIEVKNISKTYAIGAAAKDSIVDSVKGLFKSKTKSKSTFNALTDISFDVEQGEVLGIVGKNGAGKSTLLKVLSRITEPTKGEIIMRGRVASLLEVGTGFHPELSGRENIFLNGSILGMTRSEIKSKFDEIVAFSGVEKFIDTPVKHYSSGMYVRLAFSVAAHLEPEILIIDEVLAVGDAEFQQKCLGKMKDVAGQGRTVLFVSHNMSAVKSLCNKAILIEDGHIKKLGDVESIISRYLGGDKYLMDCQYAINEKIEGLDINLKKVLINSTRGQGVIGVDESFSVDLLWENNTVKTEIGITYQITTLSGDVLLVASSNYTTSKQIFQLGELITKVEFPAFIFNEGTFLLNVHIVSYDKKIVFQRSSVLRLNVLPELKSKGEWMGKSKGYFKMKLNWETKHAV